MAIDFTRYMPPGVYTESMGGPQLGVRSSVPTAVAIFGQARGYQTFRESLKVNPDTGDLQTVQLITLTGTPTGGTWALDAGDAPTAALPYNATALQVQTAIEGLFDDLEYTVAVLGANGGPYTVTIGAAVDPLNATDLLTAASGDPAVSIVSEQQGIPALNRTLAKKGILTASIKVVNPSSGAPYVVGTDFVVTRISAGEDTTPATRDDLYTIQRVVDGGHIDPGETVQLSYNYTDPLYHEVWTHYDYDDIRDMYGEPWDNAGNIISELTLCAYFAIINGASTILSCAVDPENPETVTIGDYSDALDKFRDEEQIAIIVPATGAQPIQALVQQHVTQQSANKYERRSIIGMEGSVAPVATSQRIVNAQSLTEQRIALISPSSFFYYAPEMNKEITIGGQFMAAAVAGKSVSDIAAMPLTRKNILGFRGPAENQREGEKNRESSEGLMVVEKTRRNLIQVRHGVTTNPTDLHTREWSIIGQQDVMVYRIRDYLEADGLIGQPIYDSTIVQVKASAEAALVSLVRDEIIRGYRNLKARQIATQPDVIEVRYEWRPAYPLNYIIVRYSIATESGDITTTIEGSTTGT